MVRELPQYDFSRANSSRYCPATPVLPPTRPRISTMRKSSGFGASSTALLILSGVIGTPHLRSRSWMMLRGSNLANAALKVLASFDDQIWTYPIRLPFAR